MVGIDNSDPGLKKTKVLQQGGARDKLVEKKCLCDVTCVVCGIPTLFAGQSEAETALFRFRRTAKKSVWNRFTAVLKLCVSTKFPIWSRSSLSVTWRNDSLHRP